MSSQRNWTKYRVKETSRGIVKDLLFRLEMEEIGKSLKRISLPELLGADKDLIDAFFSEKGIGRRSYLKLMTSVKQFRPDFDLSEHVEVYQANSAQFTIDKPAQGTSSTRNQTPTFNVGLGPHLREFIEVGEEVVPGLKLRCICRGHQGTIGRIAWSNCGKFIASPSQDKTIRIWNSSDGTQVSQLEGHASTVYGVAWSPCGNRIASGANDNSIKIWDPTSCKVLREFAFDWNSENEAICVEWSPNGKLLAAGFANGSVRIWKTKTWELTRTIQLDAQVAAVAWHPNGKKLILGSRLSGDLIWNTASKKTTFTDTSRIFKVNTVAWFRHGNLFACGSADGIVRVKEPRKTNRVLEAHTKSVNSLALGCDDRVLASKSSDNTIKLWRTDTWKIVGDLAEDNSSFGWFPGLAFSPNSQTLATLCDACTCLRIWDLDPVRLFTHDGNSRAFSRPRTVEYTSAKIVFVGESNVGKSCLAMRLAEDRYPADEELGTTHGMRFWSMQSQQLHPASKPPEGQRRDIVLWDFGGQDEYQLVHQMFLHDTTLAIVIIDPTRGRAAFDEARDWNKRLERHLGKDRAIKLLVGAKVDRKQDILDQRSIHSLCAECGFKAFIDLSAKTGRNIKLLRKEISNALDWSQMTKTSRRELFQAIRDEIEKKRQAKKVAILFKEFDRELSTNTELATFDLLSDEVAISSNVQAGTDALRKVCRQLADQGVIVNANLTTGDEVLILQLPVVECYAGSLIIAARNNSRGVPVLEERLLGSTTMIPLPGMTKKERLSPAKERMVLECIVELMILHGICFRHGGLLVFPTLFPSVGQSVSDNSGGFQKAQLDLPFSVSLYYDFTGAIDNIYASLVSRLMVSEEFGEGRLRAGAVEFDQPGRGTCGIRQVKRRGGLAHLDLYFSDDAELATRDLFTRFVEEHLQRSGVDICEHEAIKCKCGEEVSERIVELRIRSGEKDVVCPVCEMKTRIGEGADRIRERSPVTEQQMIALRKRIDEKTAKDVVQAKAAVSSDTARGVDDKIRLLHLSDLHFERDTSPTASLQWLLQDLRREDANFPKIDKVEYLVLSGDLTHRGDDGGFDVARQFVEQLISELGLSSLRCVIVPGNHDVKRQDTAYRLKSSVAGLGQQMYVKKDDVYLVRDEAEYPNRLKQFSDAFYHKILSSESYPLAPEKQGITYTYDDTGIQFLALNSAWEIDQFFPLRSSVHPEALANSLALAEKQIKVAIEQRNLRKSKATLRIAVFHHAVHGPWAMQNVDFISNLQAAGVKLCLHGDVHEMRRQWIDHWEEERNIHIIGAGTFGAKKDEITEGSARSYNLFEIAHDLKSTRVYVREQPKPDGAWRGWNQFPDPDGGRGKVPFFDIDLA